jgi:two-component system sensor histidine kinase VicK
LVIKDNGIGISKESLPDVFDVFTSARRIGTNGESSTGLGLSIVKKLVGILNAKIYITSESIEGTEVKVVFRKKIN